MSAARNVNNQESAGSRESTTLIQGDNFTVGHWDLHVKFTQNYRNYTKKGKRLKYGRSNQTPMNGHSRKKGSHCSLSKISGSKSNLSN